MYTTYTYQDWLAMGGGGENARKIVNSYRASDFFRAALDANRYYNGDNPTLDDKYLLRISTTEATDANGMKRRRIRQQEVAGNRVSSNFVRRFVCQQNQYLLGNGVTLDKAEDKARLGVGFDNAIQQIGERALLHGVAYGYWNLDHIEVLPAAVDGLTGCVALLDEVNGIPGAVIQFWQLNAKRPLYMRVFEPDGVTIYRDADGEITEAQPKRAYILRVRSDEIGNEIIGAQNYSILPVIALYANDEHHSELTPNILSKINAYDRILSDFGDNLDRANDVYWVLNNFGGSTDQALQVIEEIQKLKVAMSVSDGAGTASAEPKTIEVPYTARQVALGLLEKALYADFMAMSMDELTGGSLTNVAIQAAMTNLNLKCDHYEWQCFAFVQQVLRLIGIETEEIRFKRQQMVNRQETVQDIYTMRQDIDRRTALKLNPYIDQEEIEDIIANVSAEEVSGQPSMDALQRLLDDQNGDNGADDKQ